MMTAKNIRQRWIDAIVEHAAYHRHEPEGMPTHAIADCPDLAPLLAEAEAERARADRLAAALEEAEDWLPTEIEAQDLDFTEQVQTRLSALKDRISRALHPESYEARAAFRSTLRAMLADSLKEENDGG